MADTKSSNNDLLTGAAEIVGGALGTIVGTVDRLRADHPHPVDEAKAALAAGQEQVAKVAAEASSRATTVVKATKAVIANVRKKTATVRARVAKPKSRTKKAVKQVRRAAKKTVKRAKKVVARAKKSAAKSRKAAKRKR